MTLRGWAIVAGCALGALVTSYGTGYFHGQKKLVGTVSAAELAISEERGRANALKEADAAQATENARRDEVLAVSRAAMVKARNELAALRGVHPVSDPLPPTVVQPGAVGSGGSPVDVDGLSQLDKAKDEVILAQANYIEGQDAKISGMTISTGLKDKIIASQDRQIVGLHLALEAQKGLTKGALWRGRIQGLAVGAASGYLAGRL